MSATNKILGMDFVAVALFDARRQVNPLPNQSRSMFAEVHSTFAERVSRKV